MKTSKVPLPRDQAPFAGPAMTQTVAVGAVRPAGRRAAGAATSPSLPRELRRLNECYPQIVPLCLNP